MTPRDAILGSLLGTALGDSVGLWCEGMSPRRQRRFHDGPLRQRFLFGKGWASDDTEHALMVAQALLVSAGDPAKFQRSLAWRLRGWLLGAPAGIGFATLRACLKLWLGFPPSRSGVFSAGNGPAMRAGVLGVCFGDDPPRLRELVRLSTRITHTDPKAEFGALAVACAAHVAATCDSDLAERLVTMLREAIPATEHEFFDLLTRTLASVRGGESTETFAHALGLQRGVTGYIYHTLPVVLHAWLSQPRDFRAAVSTIVKLGGDSDTTGAILGSIVGAGVGPAGLPADWLGDLWEWPCGAAWIETVADRLAEMRATHAPQPTVAVNWPGLALRNAVFAVAVLAMGFRRLLPPY
jgi:ADP-ribosyl-[dinitrogen reductase] hydrolase